MKSAQLAFLLTLAAAFAGSLSAGTIGPNCGSCQGGVFSLSYSTVSTAGTNDIFNLFLTIDTTAYTGGGTYIDAVAPKAASSLVSATLLSSPATNPAGSTWTTASNKGINSGGCSSGGSGFLCTQSSGVGALVSNNTNSWSWQIAVPHDTLFTAANAASIKVLFVNSCGDKAGDIVSEHITLTSITTSDQGNVPEPATFGMLGAALALSFFARKFRS